MQFLIIFAVLLAVVYVLSAPVRAAASGRSSRRQLEQEVRVAELEAAREAKLREIRDAELDHQTGKLSDADYGALDSALRAEAVAILHELDREREAAASPSA